MGWVEGVCVRIPFGYSALAWGFADWRFGRWLRLWRATAWWRNTLTRRQAIRKVSSISTGFSMKERAWRDGRRSSQFALTLAVPYFSVNSLRNTSERVLSTGTIPLRVDMEVSGLFRL